MSKVFERYVAKKVEDIFTPNGWTVYAQAEGNTKYLFDDPQMFKLKPDIVIKNINGDKTAILDTKWKALNNNPNKNYGISQSDMYQMYAYSKKYKAENIWLLYPLNSEMREYIEKYIEYKELNTDLINTSVRVFFVDVANIDDSIKKLLGFIKDAS